MRRNPIFAMKIFLDDERTTPEGWVRAYWPSEVIALLERGGVTEVSLDHDLGDDQRGTGYDVILDRGSCSNKGVQAATIVVHSANSSARIKMELGIENIRRLLSRVE